MSSPRSGAMPLAMVEPGVPVVCVDVTGGHTLRQRLTDMGLLPGTPLKVVNSTGAGPVTVEVRGTRVALGRGMAQKIMVALA